VTDNEMASRGQIQSSSYRRACTRLLVRADRPL